MKGSLVPAKTQMSGRHLLYQDCARGRLRLILPSGWEGRHKEGGNCNLMAGASAAILALGGKFASSH